VDFEYIKPLLADASGTGDGEYTDAERRADVASQFRDKYGRWIEMGRGIKGKVRLGKNRGTDAGRTARIVGKFINATPDGKFARVLVDPSDPNFGGKIVHIRNDNAEEILATLDPEYLKKRGIQLGKNTEGFEVGDEGIQDEDTLTIEDPTPQDLEDSKADLPDPGDYKQEASTLTQAAVAGRDLATGNIVYDQGSDQYGKVTQVRTLANGTKQIFIQFQNGRRAIMNIAADHQITAWVGAREDGQQAPATGPSPKEENSVAALGIDLQTATMDANGARLPTPGAFTGAFQRIVGGAKNWADVAKRLFNQVVTYFDFETTGISNYDGDGIKNSPIQLGAVKVKNGKIIGRFNVYMNPGSKLSEWSADNLKRDVVDENGNVVLDENGKPQSTLVTPEWLAEQMSPAEALKLFLEFIGPKALLGGQNVPFDLEILQRMADEAGVKLDIAGTIDSKDLASLLPTYDPEKGVDGPKQIADKETGRMRPSSSLGPVANFLGFEPANWHSADGDAEDSYNLVRAIIDRAAKEDNQDMRLLNFPEMQRLYKERMAAFKNSISQNNPVTQKQLDALNELANSDNSVVAEEARKAIAEATTRGKAAEVLARLDNDISRPNNNTGPSPKEERGGPGLSNDVLDVLARLRRRVGLKEKKVKKLKNYVPMGFGRMSGWDQYPQEFKDIYDSAADLDQFVKMFWNLRRPGRPVDETMYAIAAAIHRSMDAIDNGRGILTYRGIRIEFDSNSDIDGRLLDELKGYLDTAVKFGFKLPTTIIFGKAGALTFDKRKLGFNPETGKVCLGESDVDENGGLRLILWDQLHNLEGDNDMVQFMGTDPKTGQDRYGTLGGERISLLLSTFSHELGHLFNREKHGKMTGSPVWAELKKIFWGSDSAPFKRFNIVPKSSDIDFDERMADLFMGAFIAFHNKEDQVLPSVAHFWKIAIEPYIDAEPAYWTDNAKRLNKKAKSVKDTAKRPKDIAVGDVLYDKDGNLHGKVVRVSKDKNGNWHYWVEGKDFKPGDVFPTGLDEYIVHGEGIVYLSKDGVHFVPDNAPDFPEKVPKTLDDSNSSEIKVEDIKPGMIYNSPEGPAIVVNIIKQGVNSDPRKNRGAKERVIVYVDPITGDIKHAVVPTGDLVRVMSAPKTDSSEPEGGSGSSEPEDPNLAAIRNWLKIAINIGMVIRPGEDLDERDRFISDLADGVIEEIKKLGLKDYAALAEYLKENLSYIGKGNPWYQVRDYVREFLDPGYGERQAKALNSIKELLKERIIFEDESGEKTDPAGGILDDILRPYLAEAADTNYEELLDLLDKNLKSGEIKHVQKLEGNSFRGNWEEVVKAVQDIISSNLGKQQPVSEESAKPTEQGENFDADGNPIKVGDLVDVIDEYGQKKTIRIYKYFVQKGYDYKINEFLSYEEGYEILGGYIVNVLNSEIGYPLNKSKLSPKNGSQGDKKDREKIRNNKFSSVKNLMYNSFIKKHRKENPNMDIEVVKKLAERDVATALEELKKLGVLDYDIFNGEFDEFTNHMFWTKTEDGKYDTPRKFNSIEDAVSAAKEYIEKKNASSEPETGTEEEEAEATATETTSESEITTDDPIGRGKIDPKGYGTNEGYVRMTHPTPDFPAETDEKNLIEKGFEIEEQDNDTRPSPKEEESEDDEEGVIPSEDPAKFAVGKKTTIIWHNKDFSSPGGRIKITYTRKADGSLDKYYKEIQWINWDGKISGDGYGPGDVLEFERDQDEQKTFRMAFEFATKALAKRNKEYNNNELPGQFPHPFKKVGNDHIWRVVKDAKTGKLKAGRDTKKDMEKKPPFGAVISHKDGKWTANILDPKGNVVATFEVDGDANDQSALENIMNQSYAELAKKYREINAPTTTPAARPAGKATDGHNFPLPDDVEMFKIRNGGLTLYGINLKADVDIFGETSASIRDGLRFGAVIEYIEGKGHWYVGLRDANSSLDQERGIKDLSLSETYKTIKGDIDDPKAWEEAVKEARKFVSDAIARHGGKNIRYGYEHRPIKSLDDVRVNDYIIFRTSYPPSVNFSDTDRPEEYISSIIGKVLSIGKDKEGNRTFKIQGKDGKIKNLTDKKLDYVGGAVRFSDDDPTIEVSTLEIVKKRVAKREMKELRYFIGMDIDKDPNKSEDSLEKIYKAVEDKIGPDLSEDHIFVQSLKKALSKKMYDKSNTKGYLTEEEIYEIADKAIEKYSTGKKSTTETEDDSEGITGAHTHPLPDDVEIFPAHGPAGGIEGDSYIYYAINGEGFRHEADYNDIGVKDGLRFGAQIHYEPAYESIGRKGQWKIELLSKNWHEDYYRGRLIEDRNAVVLGDINDPEAWKKAVEEARRMIANAVAKTGGENVPYTSEYIALESLDQLQAGDYLMNSAFFPPDFRWAGTKSQSLSTNFYAKILSVGKDKDGNRIFEVERDAVKDSKPYTTVFTDEEFIKEFGIDGGIARYSDENPNVGAPAETGTETGTEELTEEQLQANKDAWTEVGLLYRKYLAAKRGKNMKREAKRLKQELSTFPVVVLHDKLSDYKDILSNTRNTSTDENERRAITKRVAELLDAMKQLNILVRKGVDEGAGKPTDALKFNFDNLLEEIDFKVGTTTEEVTEEEEEEEEETAEETTTTEEPAKNVIETAGGVLDFSGLSPMQLGKINKHLDSKVVWEGESMTYRELYKRFAIGKRKFQVRKDTNYVNGKPVHSWGPVEYRLFIDEKRGTIKVPKMIFDAFKPTSSDPSLNEDRTSAVIEAEWAKEESGKAGASTTPTTPKGFGPVALNSNIAKKYPAMNVDKDWTIYGPDGYALGMVTKKETAGSVSKITVRDLQGKETTYNYNNLVKILALSPKDKKDIEKAEKDKAKKEDTTTPATPATSTETPTTESKDDSVTKVVKKEINDAYNVNLKLSVDEKLELWKSLRDRGLITVKNIMDVVPGDYVLAIRNLDYPKPFNWDKWGAKGYYEQEFRKVVSIENEPQRGKLRPILDDGWVSHSSNPAKADVLVLTPDAFESGGTPPEPETSDSIEFIPSSKIRGLQAGDLFYIYEDGNGYAKQYIVGSNGKSVYETVNGELPGGAEENVRRPDDLDSIAERVATGSGEKVYRGLIPTDENGNPLSARQHKARIESAATSAPEAKPAEEKPEVNPAVGTEYNKDLENDLAVFRNALEDIIENFRNQPGADKDVYKAATKEIYNELKKLNSLHNESENSGEDLEKIREVYDQKMRDIGDIQAAKVRDLGPSPKEEEVFAQSAADLQNAIIQEAVRLGEIEDRYDETLRDTLFRVANSHSIGEALKQVAAKRIYRYMPDVKFDGLLKAITTNTDALDLLHAGQTLNVMYSTMLSPTEWVYTEPRSSQKDSAWVYNAFNADLSDIKDGTELLVQPINNSMIDGLSIFTVDSNLIDAVKKSKGDAFGPAESIESKDIIDYMKDKFYLRVFSSFNQDDVDHLKQGMIGYLIKSWAISSNDNNLKMHAMQHLASEIFAMDSKATAGWNFVENENESYIANMRRAGRAPAGVNTLDDLQDYLDQRIVAEANEHKEVYTKFLYAMYNSTQDALKEAGIDGMILYRGTGVSEFKDSDKLPLPFSLFGFGTRDLRDPKFDDFVNAPQEGYVYHRPMSSWSTKFEIANTFSSRYGSNTPLIAGVKIPAERIFALPGSGFGCYNEAEVVVLGGELTPATYVVPRDLSLMGRNEFLETVKNKVGPKTILTTEKENGNFVEVLASSEDFETGPSPKEEGPSINLDSSSENADWIKQVSWDLPIDMGEFLSMFSTRDQLSYFMTEPVAVGMPEEMSRNLWPAADEHFKKIDEMPKPEEPRYLPEPFDPQDPNLDLEAFYNFDYSKNPDGSPFTRSQAGDMAYAELAVLREIHNGTEEDIKNAIRHRLDTYLKVTAKPDPKATTTVESVEDQIEGDFDLDSPVEEYPNPFNASTSIKRYLNYYTDKYGRRYALLTDIFQNNTGNLYVTAYDTTGKTPEQVQEDFIDSKNYLTPDLHIAFIGTTYATPDPNDKNYESKRYIDLVTTWPEYRRRGLATALLNVARKYSKEPIVHSTSLSNAGFAFSNSVDRNPQDHTSEKSIAWQEENSNTGPSPKEETPVGNFLPEPFDPRDKKIDLDTIYNYDYTQMPDGTPFNDADQEQMDIISRRIENTLKANNGDETSYPVLNLKNFRRTLYQQIIAKPTEGSSTTRESILNQVEFSDKPAVKYFDQASKKEYTRYVDTFTDKYGRKYYIVTNIDESSGRQTVVAYDEKNFEGMPLPEDYVRNDQPVSGMSDVGALQTYIYRDPSVTEIQSAMVKDNYQRRGLATAMVAILEKRIGLPVVHSDNLSKMGFAFSNSIDPGKPELHNNEESIKIQSETGPSPKEEIPEDDGGDEVDTNRTPGNILAAQLKVLADGLGKDFSENADYKDISVDPENLPESLDIWKNLQFMAPMSQDLKIVAAELISAEMKSSAKNILRSLALANNEELLYIGEEVYDLLADNEDESDDYDIIMKAFGTDLNNLTRDSLILSYDAEDVTMYVSTVNAFIDDDEDRPDSYFTPERLKKQISKYANKNDMTILSSNSPDISESMRYVGSVLFIKQWSQTSNNETLADALQKAAVEAFNMKDGSWATSTSYIENEPDEKLKEVMRETSKSYKEKLDYLYDMNSQVYMDFIKSMYKVTQAYLKDLGIKYVRVYRGTGVTEARDVQGDSDFKSSGVGMVNVMQRPMSSWSFDEETALGFAANSGDNDVRDPMFVATLVPAGQVLGFPGTGFGSFEEGELVLLGGFPRKVMAAVHKNNSQEKKSTGNWLSDAVVSNDPVSERDFFLRKALPQIDEHFTNLSESDTQDLLNRNSGISDSTGPSPKEEEVSDDQNQPYNLDNSSRNANWVKFVPSPKEEVTDAIAKAYKDFLDKKHPNLEYQPFDVNTQIGIGPDNDIIGLVRPEALKKIQGNLAAEPTTVNSIEQDYRSGEGLYEPVLVGYNPDTGYATVLEGNHRVQAAINAGEEFIPTVLVTWGISARDEDDSEDFTPGIVEKTPGNPFNTDVSSKTTKEVNPYFVFPDSDIYIPEDLGPSPKEEKPSKKLLKEPFDPTDFTIDLEKFYNFDYSKMPDGTPFDVYRQQQMDILTDAINNETNNFERKLRIAERRRIYQGYFAKPNLKSSTNIETIKDQVGLLDDNTSRMNYTGAGKPYADLPSEYKQSTQYVDEFTDKYGRQYWAVTKVVSGLGMSNVKFYDKSENSLQDIKDTSENISPISMLDVFNNKISMVHTSDRYLRRGLATAALYLARERSGKEVQHSEMLTSFGRAFSLSVDPNPGLHKNDESKALLLANESGPSPKEEAPAGGFLPEPFNPNDRTLDLDSIYNYDYTKLPDGTPFNAKQQKAMDHENKILEEAIASGDEAKIRAAKIARRYTYNTFITVANPDSKTNTETIANQITPGKTKPKKFTGFVRYTDNFTDKYGRKYIIFTDISTDDSSDNAVIVTAHDLESQFLEPLFTPEGMENVDRFGGKYLHISSLKVNDSDRKDLNGSAEIGIIGTDDAYRRRGLATALLYLARKHYSKPINHSSTLTMYGKAFSNSVDAGKPEVHDSIESQQLQRDILKKKGLPVEEPELDGDEIDYGPSPKEETPSGQPTIVTNKYLEVIPLNNAYRDKNDPDLDITEWMTKGTNIYGIGNGGNPLGYVRTEKLATMKGNLADMTSSVDSISQDLEDGTGYLEPVLVWYNPITGRSFIAEGNHRVEAARLTGREYVPVIVGVSTVDFKNPSKVEKAGGVGDTVLNKDGSLGKFRNVKDGAIINPYHLFNDEDLLYPRVNLDPNDVPGFTDVLKIQSELLDERMVENQETGINDIAKWYDPNTFDVDSPIAFMGETPEKLKDITARNIGDNMMSSVEDMLAAVNYGIWIGNLLRNKFNPMGLDSEKIAKKALDTKSDKLSADSIVLFIDESEHSSSQGIVIRTLGDLLDEMDPDDEETYGTNWNNADYKTLLKDYYANEDFKAIFFDKPKDVLAFKAKVASMLVAQWAETSNGNDMQSHALQMAAVDAFKMPDGSWAEWKFPKGSYGDQIKENAEYHYLTYGTVLKDFLKTMYNLTQDRFKNYGVKYLTLYRGTGVDEESLKIDTGIEYNGIGDVEVLQRPMSAWTWLYGTALNFTNSRLAERAGMFMGTIVPVEQVLSIPGTGFGCFEEAEVVLLAGKQRLVRAVTSDSSDPDLNQKAFINQNKDQVISYLLDQLPKDRNAFDNLIEFNKSDFGSTGPSPKEEEPLNVDNSIENSDWVISEFAKKKDATEPVDKQTILAAINDIQSIADVGLPVEFEPPARSGGTSPSKRTTKRGTVVRGTPMLSKIETDAGDIEISYEQVAIQNSKELAAKPTEKAIEVKNKIISLGNKILGPAKKAVDRRMIDEGLLPEGVDLDQHRLDLADDIAARTEIIKEKNLALLNAIEDINRNAFKKLPYEVQEEIYQILRENPAMYTIDDFFKANDNLNMARTDGEGLEQLYKQATMEVDSYRAIKLFSGRKIWLERKKAKGRGYEKVLEDYPDFVGTLDGTNGADRLENILLVTALNKGFIDLSEVKKMSDELRSLRESATEVQNPRQFVNKYHRYLGEEVKKQLESLGMEFGSVDMSNVIGMVKPIAKYTTDQYRYGYLSADDYKSFMNQVTPSINSLDPKILEELKKAMDTLPKSFLMSMKNYYESISKKLGIRPSEARAHFFTASNGNGIVRGDKKDDFLHEFAHFFQGINPELIAIEHAFTYDRVRNEDGTLKPIMEVPYTNDVKDNSDTFSGANVVEPYIVKQYETNTAKRLGARKYTEVLTMGIQDLFGDESAGRSVTPTGVTIVTGKGSRRTYYSEPHMDIATGIWYTDKTMTNKIDLKKITGISGLDKSSPTDWDFKALTIGLLLALADLEDN
jgi:DNA polymerase III epsilon subunit-like protein/ribosomal protein S18 acetylase RimI-like enzyme